MAYQEASSYSQARPAQAKPAPAKSPPAPAPAGSKRPKEGTGGKRYVRTQEGARRYKKPIGAEIIAEPRDQRGKQAQSDKESTDRYKALIGSDRDAQEKAMRGLNEDQLKRLSEVAFSFRSSDPEVARLRAGVSLELKRRGLDPNRYGGLAGRGKSGATAGGSSGTAGSSVEVINWATGERYRTQTKAGKKASARATRDADADERRAHAEAERQESMRRRERERAARAAEVARKKAERDQAAAARKAESERNTAARLANTRASNVARYSRRNQRASVILPMSRPEFEIVDLTAITAQARTKAASEDKALPGGRFPIRNVADLRNAIQAFGRAKPEDRQKIARFICRRAEQLNAKHLVGEGIKKAAGYHDPSDERVKADLTAGEFRVIDLEGRWKHGWIPLDAAAVRAKTKGRQGAKPWWDAEAKGRMTPRHEGGRLTPRHSGGKLTDRNENATPGRITPKHEGGKLTPRHSGGKLTPRNENRDSPERTTVVKSGMTPNQPSPGLTDAELKELTDRRRDLTRAGKMSEASKLDRRINEEKLRRRSQGPGAMIMPNHSMRPAANQPQTPAKTAIPKGQLEAAETLLNFDEAKIAKYKAWRAAGDDHNGALTKAKRNQTPKPGQKVVGTSRQQFEQQERRQAAISQTRARSGASTGVESAKTQDPAAARFDRKITQELQQLTGGKPNEWVSINELQVKLMISKETLHKHLKRMSAEGKLHLAPDSNRKALSDFDRQTALTVGGEPQHLVALTG